MAIREYTLIKCCFIVLTNNVIKNNINKELMNAQCYQYTNKELMNPLILVYAVHEMNAAYNFYDHSIRVCFYFQSLKIQGMFKGFSFGIFY